MKNNRILGFLLILVLSHLSSLILPWWIFSLVAIAVVWLFSFKEKEAFLISFLAVFILWLVYSLWLNGRNSFILGNQVGEIFGGLTAVPLVLIGALVAGIIAGFSGWLGSQIRHITVNNK